MIDTWQFGELIYDLCESHGNELLFLLRGTTPRNFVITITFDVFPEVCCACEDKSVTVKGLWRAIIAKFGKFGGPSVMRICKR